MDVPPILSFPDIPGFFAAGLIGLTLGVFGGGGSILAVPALTYLEGVPATLATAYSLLVVGLSALTGAVSYFRRGYVNLCAAMVFALPSFVTVALARHGILPMLPDAWSLGAYSLTRDGLLLMLFALVMAAAAISMLRGRVSADEIPESEGGACFIWPRPESGAANDEDCDATDAQLWSRKRLRVLPVLLSGAGVGLVTGLFGAGGGFLIVPALTRFARLPVRYAIGASLLIIAANSLFGFANAAVHEPIRWSFVLTFAAATIPGVWLGARLARRAPALALKRVFGVFVLATGAWILWRELPRLF